MACGGAWRRLRGERAAAARGGWPPQPASAAPHARPRTALSRSL